MPTTLKKNSLIFSAMCHSLLCPLPHPPHCRQGQANHGKGHNTFPTLSRAVSNPASLSTCIPNLTQSYPATPKGSVFSPHRLPRHRYPLVTPLHHSPIQSYIMPIRCKKVTILHPYCSHITIPGHRIAVTDPAPLWHRFVTGWKRCVAVSHTQLMPYISISVI